MLTSTDLWVVLGEKPDTILPALSDLIEILLGERPGFKTVDAAAAKLDEALGDRSILLIIDDAWREQDLQPFLGGGCNTTRLITTRRDDILPLETERQAVDAMATGEALSLLSKGLPRHQAAGEQEALAALAARLGEWPQLLKFVNAFLRNSSVSNKEPLQRAIAGVNRRLDLRGLTAFDAKTEADRTNAIAKTIDVSLELLDERERARFADLAVFPEDVDVPLGVVARFWREFGVVHEIDTEDILRRLESLSLLLALDLDRRVFRIHDTVRKFLQQRAGKDVLAELHERLLKALDGIEADTGVEEASRRYYFLYRPAHLAAAGDRNALDALLLDPSWLKAKLEAVGNPEALVTDYDQLAQGDVQSLIGATLRISARICARDKSQLAPQLFARLISRVEASEFCRKTRKLLGSPALTIRRDIEISTELKPGHTAPVTALKMLPEGWLASASSDKTVRLWDVNVGAETRRIEFIQTAALALATISEGLAVGCADHTIRLCDVNTGVETAQLEGNRAPVVALAVLPDGRIASASLDRTVRLWDEEHAPKICERGPSGPLAFISDDQLAWGSYNCIRVWDLKANVQSLQLKGHSGSITALAVLPEGRLASASFDRSIRIWDLKTGTQIRLDGHYGAVTALASLPSGYLFSGSLDRTIRIWDAQNGKELAVLDLDVQLSAVAVIDDRWLVAGDYSGRIHWLEIVD